MEVNQQTSSLKLKMPLLIQPAFYRMLIVELFQFIIRPTYSKESEQAMQIKLYKTIGLFLIKVVFSLVIANLLALFYEPENITDRNMQDRFTPFMFLSVGGIVLPFFEEICFRLSLRYNAIYLSVTSASLAYYVFTKAIYQSRLSIVDESFTERLVLAMMVGLLCYFILLFGRFSKVLKQIWREHFQWIFYASCVLFAWLHIFNFELNVTNLLLLPTITLPQLFSSCVAAYTRMAFGFRYPLILHMSTNLLFISLSFLPID